MTLPWVRLPSAWINQRGLIDIKWENGGAGANGIAALMLLTVIAHRADPVSGQARVTYEEFCAIASLSRPKVSQGLSLLERLGVIQRGGAAGPSVYQLVSFTDDDSWAKLPAKSMYSSSGRIAAFADFALRRPVELDAMKLFLLVAARRDRQTNLAKISYPKIEEYSGIRHARIKSAISYLAGHDLLHVEHVPSTTSEHGIANAYRLPGIEPYNHMGTRGRGLDASAFE